MRWALVAALCALGTGQTMNFTDENSFYEWARMIKAQASEPDDNWLKTCAGWSAQMLCGAVFGAGIDEETARREDVSVLFGLAAESRIDWEQKKVVTRCLWDPTGSDQTYTSIYRDRIGCTLVEGITESELRAQRLGNLVPPGTLDPTTPWPRGEGPATSTPPPGVDMECVRNRIAAQFADTAANPRAIVVIYRGQLIFERYAPTVNRNTPLLGWSATKSVVNAFMGILVGEGRVDLRQPARVPEWRETPGDPRAAITNDQMLRMTSGTQWGGGILDVLETTQCLFWSNGNCPRACGRQPLLHPPDTVQEYNSGSTYLLSRIIQESRGDPELTNFEWPLRKLFWRIAAHSFYIEYQPNRVFLGGSLGYATARDWARFGLLFQRDGVWVDGQRILPEGWVRYSTTPTLSSYGAHWARNPNIDPRLFYASGFRNENVYIFPHQELIIVRLAMPDPLYQFWNGAQFLRDMLTCFAPAASNSTTA